MRQEQRRFLAWTALFFCMQVAVTYLNRHHAAEQGIFTDHYLAMAAWLRGQGQRAVLTYPIWGYPLLLAVLSPAVVLVLQGALAAVALAAVRARLVSGALPGASRLTMALCVLALPWFFLQSVKWPAAPAASLLVLSLLLLERALTGGGRRAAVGAGLLSGLALNLRSDYLLFVPGVILAVLLGRALRRIGPVRLAALTVYGAAALASLLPWALFTWRYAGHPGLTSSNGGMVAYISLGQLPDNPWGIAPVDEAARERLRRDGYDLPPYSDRGNALLWQDFLAEVRQRPGVYARKVFYNLLTIFRGGFYNGEPQLAPAEQAQLEVVKEKLKLRAGVTPNPEKIAALRQQGLWDSARVGAGTLLAVAWLLLATAVGDLFLLAAAAGLLYVALRRRPWPLLDLLCGAAALYQVALSALLQYQPRHMNGIYLFCLPFCLVAAQWAGRRRTLLPPAHGR